MTKKMKRHSNLLSTGTVGGWTLISRIFGLLRDLSTTSLQGASLYHDIFILILRIPTSLRTFLIEGAFSNAFIPIYSGFLGRQKIKESIAFVNSLFGLVLIIFFLLTIIALIFPNIFIFIFAPGYLFDPEKNLIAIDMHRIMFPYLSLLALVSLAGGIQNSHNKFAVPAATPILFNICVISSAFLLSPYFNIPIYGLAYGVLFAGFFQVFFQIPSLRSLKISLKPSLNLKAAGLKKFFLLLLPSLVVGSLLQVNLVIDSIFSSFLPIGSPTWLYISQRLMQLPLGIFAIAVSTVLLPSLSKLYAAKNTSEYSASLNQGLRLVIFLGAPSAVGLAIFSEPIVGTIFNRGEFSWSDVQMTAYSLTALTIGLPFFMIQRILAPAFFSRLNARTPMIIGIISILINILANYILGFHFEYGHIGLAIASTFAVVLSISLLLWVLAREKILNIKSLFHAIYLKIFVSSVILAFYLLSALKYFNFEILEQAQRIVYLILTIGGGVIIYISLCLILGIRFEHFRTSYLQKI
ncbi:murein biosynthesis integral membrane protein MurJ [Gammaproteobacteria bacterium]|nr:murein biosynthesis integral membrane protein MurJ [Gammaproteobacteria bacterium]